MRIIGLLLTVVLFIPITSFAEENQFIERQYILGNHNPERYDNIEEGCEWATDFLSVEIVSGGTSELRAIQTRKEDGKIRKEGDTVGELELCIGDLGERDHPRDGCHTIITHVAFSCILFESTSIGHSCGNSLVGHQRHFPTGAWL